MILIQQQYLLIGHEVAMRIKEIVHARVDDGPLGVEAVNLGDGAVRSLHRVLVLVGNGKSSD